MANSEILNYCLDSLLKSGADKAQIHSKESKRYEMNVEGEEISLLRTTFNTDLNITAINGGRKGSISINKTDKESVDDAVTAVIEMSQTADMDQANDISPYQQYREFYKGGSEPDLSRMYEVLKKFAVDVKVKYPKIILQETFLDFTYIKEEFINTNDVRFKTASGIYNFAAVFASKDGQKSSSFNYSSFSEELLDRDLLESGSINTLLGQSIEQLDTKALEGKFTGDIIITPDCLGDMVQMYTDISLRDMPLMSGTSLFKDKLNNLVASPKLTLHSMPVSEDIADGYFITPDGFEAKNSTIIERGILKSFLLSLYGANKTGIEKAPNTGNAYVVDPGSQSLEEIIKSTEKGLLVCRFSGGRPAPGGDFSGVAKNSYFIENGEIKYPVSETMISGNLFDMFKDIREISKERINFGNCIFPWICTSGITISGK